MPLNFTLNLTTVSEFAIQSLHRIGPAAYCAPSRGKVDVKVEILKKNFKKNSEEIRKQESNSDFDSRQLQNRAKTSGE